MATDVSSIFKSSEIVPDVVDTAPKELLSVSIECGVILIF